MWPSGSIDQLELRLNGIEEIVSSSPTWSTSQLYMELDPWSLGFSLMKTSNGTRIHRNLLISDIGGIRSHLAWTMPQPTRATGSSRALLESSQAHSSLLLPGPSLPPALQTSVTGTVGGSHGDT